MKRLLILAVLCAGLISVTAFAQSKLITGKVITDKGDPVPFATVTIKNSKSGTAADAQGVFNIKANSGDVLIIGSSGFTAKEVPVGAENNITVLLVQVSQ